MMIVFMMMGMMLLLFAIVAHFVLSGLTGSAVLSGDAATERTVSSWSALLEGVRRFGVATYLLAIVMGLTTIITVLRFQSQRIRELANEKPVFKT